jgi:hypothetical protein
LGDRYPQTPPLPREIISTPDPTSSFSSRAFIEPPKNLWGDYLLNLVQQGAMGGLETLDLPVEVNEVDEDDVVDEEA